MRICEEHKKPTAENKKTILLTEKVFDNDDISFPRSSTFYLQFLVPNKKKELAKIGIIRGCVGNNE